MLQPLSSKFQPDGILGHATTDCDAPARLAERMLRIDQQGKKYLVELIRHALDCRQIADFHHIRLGRDRYQADRGLRRLRQIGELPVR